MNAFVACRTLSFDHCALEHSFSLVGPEGETTIVSLDDKGHYDNWFNTLEVRLDAVSAIKAYNSNKCR